MASRTTAVDGQGEILPVGRSQWGGGHGASGAGGSRPEEPEPPLRSRPRLDEVVLTEPHRATLSLLRHRVLEQTRQALELPRHGGPAIAFAALDAPGASAYVGRLLSDANLLAAPRRGVWPAARVEAALEQGMTDGLAETLEVLHELGELDAEAWQLVCSVLEELHRKVAAVTETDS